MKKLGFALVFFLTTLTIFAQDDNDDKSKDSKKSDSGEIKTMFSNVNKVSGFGALDLEYAPIDGEVAVFTGGSGGVMLGNMILGGYGIGLSTSTNVSVSERAERLRFSHGGFLVGFDFAPKRLVHLMASTKLGWGSVNVGEEGFVGDPGEWFGNASETVFVIQPLAGIEINMTKFFKIALTGQYRLVQGADDIDGFDAGKLNNASVGLSLKFGWFE